MKAILTLLLVGAGIGLAGCGRQQAGAPAEGTIVLNYANFPPAATFPCVQMERWKQEVERRTGGAVKINTYPGGTLLGAKDIFDGVIAGTADIGNFAMSYQPGRFPVSEAMDLPHFFPDAKSASRILAGLIERFQPAEFEPVKVLTLFTCPPAVVMSAKEIKTLADLKNLPLRSSGTGAEVMKRLGATPVAMPQSDVPDALQKGVVKGNVSSGEVLKDMNYAAYCPFVYKADLCVTSFAVVMNKAKYEALPAAVKQVFDDLYHEHAEWTGAYVDQHVKTALEWAKEKHALAIQEPSEADRAILRATAQPLIADYVARVSAKGIDAEGILATIRSQLPQ
ncbi:MAG TPA: TRAP transporter substrate-binding protein [Kiritimatiellia bacterium]|nr:TRAP transporter substrate-binding protein [Kiritimatiellia bacterium]HRU71612.1 TRAP transporter substrate-binding protein [Kiritimatiellia bacterium]